MANILVIDDDPGIRELMADYLGRNGHKVDTAENGKAMERALLASGSSYDLLILDVMMPGEDGITLTRDLRRTMTMPILLLTAKGESINKIEGFEAGADDYLVKPFEPKELLLRINAILRRVPAQSTAAAPKVLHMGAVRYDMERGELWRGQDLIRLTATEAMLMRVFSTQPGIALSRDKLVGDAPVEEGGGQERAVDVQITRLRRKIEDDPKSPRYLQTVRGEGYMLQPD